MKKISITIISKIIKIFFLTIMSLALISAGWWQEIYWYRSVLTGNGLEPVFSLITGSSLSLLLCHFAIKKMKVSFTVLLLFSMLFTIVGQNQAYNKKKNAYIAQTEAEQRKLNLFDKYTKNIEKIDLSILKKENMIPPDMKDQAIWKSNGIDPIRADIAILKSEKKVYEDKLEEIVLSKAVVLEPKTSYENFAKDIPFISPTLLRYLFLVLQSFFIGLMAPSGFTIIGSAFNSQGGVVVNKPKKDKEEVVTVDNLVLYANSLFRNEERPSTLKGRDDVTKETSISQYYFNKKSAAAKKLGLIVTNGNMTTPNVTRSEFIMMMRNKTACRRDLTSVL